MVEKPPEQLATNEGLDQLRDILLPCAHGGIFENFCKSDLVSHDANDTCWNGTLVVDVNQDTISGNCNTSHELASQTECKSFADSNKAKQYLTCCTNPQQSIMTSLNETAAKNWAFISKIREPRDC